MSLVGYCRVSSTGQSLDIQKELLEAAGCTKLFQEKKSGRKRSDRPALQDALDYVREGDVFMVTRLDRLARSIVDLRNVVDRLEAKRVGFRVLQQSIDTTTSEGRLMLNLLGSFAEFENDIRRERQREGIDRALAEGRYKGRPRSVDGDAVRKLKAEGVGPAEIARRLNVGRASVYRMLKPETEAA